MAGTAEANDCSFVWDETSQLYFHARFSLTFKINLKFRFFSFSEGLNCLTCSLVELFQKIHLF